MKQTELVVFSRATIGPSRGVKRVKRSVLKRLSLQDLARGSALPSVTVIGPPDSKPTRLQRVTRRLAALKSAESLVVFSAPDGASLARQLDVVSESLKAEHARGLPEGAGRASALDALVQETKITADLRTNDGWLSAKNVAKLYGLPLKELADLLGRTRQAVGKTPAAESLQLPLRFFERIARLRAALKDDASFRKWLRISNRHLGGQSPLEWIRQGRWQDVADLVDDILTGTPS